MKSLYDAVREAVQKELDDIFSFKEDQAVIRSAKRKRTTAQNQPSKKSKNTVELRTDTVDELRNYLRVVDFEHPKSKEEAETEKKSMISTFSVVESSEGDYLIFHREYESFRVFNFLWDIIHLIDIEDLFHLYQQVQTYFGDSSPTGVGLVLLGDLTTIWETNETSTDALWENQEDWEITSWRFFESAGVHVLELEDGTMIRMLAERRYPLTRDLMLRMLDHGMEVEDENETALIVIEFFIKWTKSADDE